MIAKLFQFLLITILFLTLCACNHVERNKSHETVPYSSIVKGKVLAAKYCQSCHLLPDPSSLDASTWELGVLPAMGPRLGIFDYGFQHYQSSRRDKYLPPNFYPAKPMLSSIEWQNIIDYFSATAPDSMPQQSRPKNIKHGLSLFRIQVPTFNYPSPAICFTGIDTTKSSHELMSFDLARQQIFTYDQKLSIVDSSRTDASITDILFDGDTLVACNINFMNPTNAKFGQAQELFRDRNGSLKTDSTALFNGLGRPVQMTAGDLNGDQRTDYVVCEFGNLIGDLTWLENTGNKRFTRHVLKPQPGAIKAYIEDHNKDGLPDIWALFSQGDEGIHLFINKGNGQFEDQLILRFPALYGSTYFELADINKDGFKDIIYTCGDNADYSLVLKPYHGMYIFLNDGKDHFTQNYFYPINGCYKALARDYDGDGDLDIATIAFFADYAVQPEEGFIYLENKGSLNFDPFTIDECKNGRWLTMDAGDLDGDGRIDIVLGNFSIRPSIIKPQNDWTLGPPLMILKNIGK